MLHRPRLDRGRDPDATVDARLLPGTPPKRRCGRVELVDHPGHLTESTRSLLRIRLRAAALISLIGFSLFLVYAILPVDHSIPQDDVLLTFHVFTVSVLAACAWKVWRPREMCLFTLRVVELLVFGVPAFFFVFFSAFKILSCAHCVHPYAADPYANWIILIFSYSLFIPNRWKRALIVNGLFTILAIGTTVALCVFIPEVRRVHGLSRLIPVGLELLIACGAATYGTYLIGTLRREVFEAKQLGQYRLGKKIGSGGMGEVYLAEHEMLKRPCAIKIIRAEQAGDPTSLARFEREVMAMAKLSHWNTVEIFDYGRTADGTFYYVMEYLPGLSLNDLVEKHGALPPERVIHLLRQVCDALAEAHSLGFLHRDIKPGNIFAALRGGVFDVAKLLDFGLVKPLSEASTPQLTQDGVVTGTPHFISPEQATNGPIDARSDIYSLGAVAFFLLTGRPPFDGDSVIKVLISHARDEVTPPSQLRPGIPDDLEQVVLRCLAKSPSDRYSDVFSFRQALDDCQDANGWNAEMADAWWNHYEPAVPAGDNWVANAPRLAVAV